MYHSTHGAAGCLHQHQTEAKTAQQGMTAGFHSHGREGFFRGFLVILGAGSNGPLIYGGFSKGAHRTVFIISGIDYYVYRQIRFR